MTRLSKNEIRKDAVQDTVAAAATTRALLRNPSTTASRALIPCTKASRIRVTRNTW